MVPIPVRPRFVARLRPFSPFRGGAAYGDGREDDDEGYENCVEELSGQRGPGFAEDSVEEVLDGRVPGQGGDEPERRGYELGEPL
jgi:hypothetical protein